MQQLFCTATYIWCDDVKVVNTEIMGYQCCRCVLSHVSLLFPRPLHLPLRTDVPLRDRQPLFVQTQACPILCCVCVCVCLPADLCMPSSGFCVTSRKSQEKQKWTLCKQPVTKLLESLSNSLFTLSIMFSVDKLFSTGEGMDSVLSLWYFMPLPPVSQCQPQPDA